MNGDFHQVTLSVKQPGGTHKETSDMTTKVVESAVYYHDGKTSKDREETKTLTVNNPPKDKEVQTPRSRGSSNSSQITLTTSYSKMEDEGNNNGNNQRTDPGKEINCNGKTFSLKLGENTDMSNKNVKGKCTCWNCEKKKKGISSLTHRCLFKTKSQSATLETIAKKLLPNPTKNKFSKDCEPKNGECNPPKKNKLSKTFSSYTISNSSLQDLDESEFTSSELADIMGQMKWGNEAQV